MAERTIAEADLLAISKPRKPFNNSLTSESGSNVQVTIFQDRQSFLVATLAERHQE